MTHNSNIEELSTLLTGPSIFLFELSFYALVGVLTDQQEKESLIRWLVKTPTTALNFLLEMIFFFDQLN